VTARDRFENYYDVVKNDPLGHKRLILKSLEAAIEAVLPQNLMKDKISVKTKHFLTISGEDFDYDLREFDKVIVVGGGKASGAMAEELERRLPKEIEYSGVISILEGTSNEFHTRKITLLESSHPIPSEKSVKATTKIMQKVSQATSASLVLCLISGGGSSLMALPANGITLDDKVKTTSLLLKSGANIEKMNCVRKHLSLIKGGQLVKNANGARILSLIISDIVGNPIGSIASGPTAPDPTTFGEALSILEEHDLSDQVPTRVLRRLKDGAKGKIPETPKPRDPIFRRVTNSILGDNSVACKETINIIKKNGNFKPYYLGSDVQGESRDVATNLSSFFLMVRKGTSEAYGFAKPCAFVWGGETTVNVRGRGIGGRNQEEALSALQRLGSIDGITIAFMGTDGKDGFSDAAGAIVDSEVDRIANMKKLNPEDFLRDNDSNSFFRKVGKSLLVTGPTGTNVNDIGLALVQ